MVPLVLLVTESGLCYSKYSSGCFDAAYGCLCNVDNTNISLVEATQFPPGSLFFFGWRAIRAGIQRQLPGSNICSVSSEIKVLRKKKTKKKKKRKTCNIFYLLQNKSHMYALGEGGQA